MSRDSPSHFSSQERIDIEIGKLHRQVAGHVAPQFHVSIENEAGFREIRARRQLKLPAAGDGIGSKATDGVTVQRQAVHLEMGVDDRFINGAGALGLESRDPGGLHTSALQFKYFSKIETNAVQVEI